MHTHWLTRGVSDETKVVRHNHECVQKIAGQLFVGSNSIHVIMSCVVVLDTQSGPGCVRDSV